MRTVIPTLIAVAGLSLLILAHAEASEPPRKVPLEGTVTLRKGVPTEETYGFTTAEYGLIRRHGKVYNCNSQIAFHRYEPNHISVAIQGGEKASIRQVVAAADRGGKGLFKSVRRAGATIVGAGVQPFELPTPNRRVKSVPPVLGGVYVIRIDGVATGNPKIRRGGTVYVKIQILEFEPDHHVRIRWAII